MRSAPHHPLPAPRRHPPAASLLVTALAALSLTGARAAVDDFETLARNSLAQLEGEIALPGLRAPVEIVRDRWGVPHIYAQNTEDLFFAQGYVHAQDRLWQMDSYRRVWEGRLAETLGPDYLEHDRLMRLLRYRGPFDDREWQTYHPEGRRIFDAFAAGVNAYIAAAGPNLPVEFKLTGLEPAPWTVEASVLRTQTALPIGDARAELALARAVAQYGAEEANRRARPSPFRELVVPDGIDVAAIDDAVIASLDALRTGTPRFPLLPRYQQWLDALPSENTGAQENSPGSNNWAVSGRLTQSGRVIVANDPHRNVGNPSIRYIVHLVAPGWDVIGATEAPLPGVAIGHNGRIAWGLTIVGTDQSDVFVEQLDPTDRSRVRWRDGWEPLRVVLDTIRVRGGGSSVVELKYSRHGPIFHEDTVRNLAYALRSTMHEPGSAGYLGALRYHALDDCVQFLDAQQYYHAPTENMVCGDAAGNIAWQASALSPKRAGWHGRLPVPGTGEFVWDGFRSDLPRELNPERGWIATANHDIHPDGYDPPLFFKTGTSWPRFERLEHVFGGGGNFTVGFFERLQHDTYSADAARDLPLFRGWTAARPAVERARALLEGWDANYRRESAAAAIYSIVARRLPPEARTDGTPRARRDSLVAGAIAEAVDSMTARQGPDPAGWRWGRFHTSQLPHPLVRAYDLPAVERSGGAGTVAATGATFRQIIDFADLDGSVATNAPGQSAQPFSPFYGNLAGLWADERYFPLSYSRAAVAASARHRLVLTPAR